MADEIGGCPERDEFSLDENPADCQSAIQQIINLRYGSSRLWNKTLIGCAENWCNNAVHPRRPMEALEPSITSSEKKNKITRGQWLVLLAAFLGWLFDGFEMGLFPVVASPALTTFAPAGANVAGFVGDWMGRITAAFLIGAAAGGMVFGWLGDRIGRVRALSFSILTYSVFTALGFFARSPEHLAFFRFVAALGMGGEWSLGVALVMECWPEKLRPLMAGFIGAAANFGFLLVAWIANHFKVTQESWRWMFLVGALPALLVFLIRLFVPESEKWKAVANPENKPLREIFQGRLVKHTLLGILFASIALIGTWGSVQWIPTWVDQLTGGKVPGAKSVAQMSSAFGAIVGSLLGPLVGGKIGRRPAFFGLCLCSLVICQVLFRGFHEYTAGLIATIFLTGMFTAAFYGWFPLYLPELFPTRVRATGQGVSYNTGRVFAAFGAIFAGQLVTYFAKHSVGAGSSYASMGTVITMIYLLGLISIWFAPETKGKPLPA
jgi:MFS transporter, SHS family, sialic acid transporter